MKKTTYAIIAAIALVFIIGICYAIYAARTAVPYTPMNQRVPIENVD